MESQTLVPEVFLIFHRISRSCEKAWKAAKRRTRVAKRREEKNLWLLLDLNLTFMQTPGSGFDPRVRIGWYFYKHANKYDWSVWLAIPRGWWGYLLLYLPEKKMCLQNTAVLSLYKCSRFVCVLHWFCLGQCLQRNLTAELEERFPEIKSLNDEHQILARSHKSVAKMYSPAVFATLSIESKFIIIRLIPVGKYPCLTGYSYPHRVIILVVCTLKFLVDSCIISQTAKPWHFNRNVDEHHLLQEAYAFLFGSPDPFLQNEKWRYLLRNMFGKQLTFAIVANENILANTHIDPGQVGPKIPLLTTRVETLAADTHVIAKLPLVPFWIIKLTRLTAGVCMKVRFKSEVTRGFSLLAASRLVFAAALSLSHAVKYQEKPLGPG